MNCLMLNRLLFRGFMKYTQEFIEKLIEKTDIIEVINESLKLYGAANKRRFLAKAFRQVGRLLGVGLSYNSILISCPFHKEETKSCIVSPGESSGFFECLSCGIKGDVIKFVMKYKGLEFEEAVDSLIKRLEEKRMLNSLK